MAKRISKVMAIARAFRGDGGAIDLAGLRDKLVSYARGLDTISLTIAAAAGFQYVEGGPVN